MSILFPPNEPVGKVLFTSDNDVFGGHLTLPKHEIVDCGAFYEVTFFCISPKNLLGDFFYSLNASGKRQVWSAAKYLSDLTRWLANFIKTILEH
jgi:hypothetical protein